MSAALHRFVVAAIPLGHPDVVDFLMPPSPAPRGTLVTLLGQRPSKTAQARWLDSLRHSAEPTVETLLALDNPHTHLTQRHTDRLVPVQFLHDEPDFLTRAIGGWAALFFGVFDLPDRLPDDPLLNQLTVLSEYGPAIRYVGADVRQVAARLSAETGHTSPELATAFLTLAAQRRRRLGTSAKLTARLAYVTDLYAWILTGRTHGATIPRSLLLDELMDQMVWLELRRRRAAANGAHAVADTIAAWQTEQQTRTGLILLLKGEYIVGRHRRSTVLIAPELNVVVKQPGVEPLHEIELNARTARGQSQNWPALTGDGALVTARGRLRLIIEENVLPRLCGACGYDMQFSTLMGLTLEAYITGPTIQQAAFADAERLTLDLYEEIVVYQQVAEALGIENGDWHTANFVIRERDGALVHVDWGAARPLRQEEYTAEGYLARLNQVRNIAFSLFKPPLVARMQALHDALLADPDRLQRIRERAYRLARPYGGRWPDDFGGLDAIAADGNRGADSVSL